MLLWKNIKIAKIRHWIAKRIKRKDLYEESLIPALFFNVKIFQELQGDFENVKSKCKIFLKILFCAKIVDFFEEV